MKIVFFNCYFRTLMFLTFLFCTIFCLGQNVDSLIRIYNNKSVHDTLKASALLSHIEVCLDNGSDSALILIEKLNTLKGVSLDKYIALGFLHKARFYLDIRNLPEALKASSKGLEIYKSLNDKIGISVALNCVGNVYFATGNAKKGLECRLAAIEYVKQLPDKGNLAGLYMNTGNDYFNMDELDKTIFLWDKALAIYYDIKDSVHISQTLSAIGQIYVEKKDFVKAKDNLVQAIKLLERMGNKPQLIHAYKSIGDIELEAKNIDAAKQNYYKSLAIAQEINDKTNQSFCLLIISDFYKDIHQTQLAIQQAEKALKLAQEEKEYYYIKWAGKSLWQLNVKVGNYKGALSNYIIYRNAKDSLTNVSQVKKFADQELKIKEEVFKSTQAKRELEFKLTEKNKQDELERAQFVRNIVIIGFIILFLLAGVIFYSLQQNKKKSKLISEQKHLIEEKQKEVMDSIRYARRIQTSLMPTEKYIDKFLGKFKGEK